MTAQKQNTPNTGKWLGLMIFSAVLMLLSGTQLYKAIAARFSPAPAQAAPAVQQEETARQPKQDFYQAAASSAAAQAASLPQAQQTQEPPALPPEQTATPAKAAPAAVIAATMEKLQPARPAATQDPSTEDDKTETALPAQKARKVRLSYGGRETGPVQVAGTFSSWKPLPMKLSRGMWTAELFMPPGSYRYYFIVGGVRKSDPQQPLRKDGHSVLVVR